MGISFGTKANRLKILCFFLLTLSSHPAKSAHPISIEYHQILGTDSTFSPGMGQEDVLESLTAVIQDWASSHGWAINHIAGDLGSLDISFFDTERETLALNDLILRQRTRSNRSAWTLKLRNPDGFSVRSVFEGARVPLKVKFERDIQWTKSGQKVVNFSESGTFEFQTLFQNLSEMLEIFPHLEDRTSLPKSGKLQPKLSFPILEKTYQTAEIVAPDSNTELSFEAAFWTVKDCENRIIELSVRIMDGPDQPLLESAIHEIFALLPGLDSAESKTRLIYTLCGVSGP